MLFNGWEQVARVLIVGTAAYAALIVLLRVSGKRTLSKMNAFDFVVTVAIGSTLATILLSQDVALLEGIVALALLIFLQYSIALLSVHSALFRRLVKSEPRLLFHEGEFLPGAMRRERVTAEEIRQAVRSSGAGEMKDVDAVVLETDGRISVIPARGSALANVERPR